MLTFFNDFIYSCRVLHANGSSSFLQSYRSFFAGLSNAVRFETSYEPRINSDDKTVMTTFHWGRNVAPIVAFYDRRGSPSLTTSVFLRPSRK